MSIGLEEMIDGNSVIAMPLRHPPGQDVAEVLAKLLRENHVLTQELEDSKEDVMMYEQVARDVETKWMRCEGVIDDLRSQVSPTIPCEPRDCLLPAHGFCPLATL